MRKSHWLIVATVLLSTAVWWFVQPTPQPFELAFLAAACAIGALAVASPLLLKARMMARSIAHSKGGDSRGRSRWPARTARVTLALLLGSVPGAAPESQRAQQPASSTQSGGGTQWMSPAVVASWITEQHGDEPVQLRIVILWRGTPGWFVRAGGSSVSGGGSPTGDAQTSRHTIVQGGIRLTFDFDAATGVATVQGKTLDLGEDNVVLVDDVDSPSGPRVSGTMRVTRPMPGSAGQIGLVLRTSPEIMSFLRCDAVVPDGPPKALVERLCVQNLGVAR